jgi:hypothetical protein
MKCAALSAFKLLVTLETLFIIGFIVFVTGIAFVYVPAACIIGGLILMALALRGAS